MRIAFLIATLALGLRFGLIAHATTNEYQEQRAELYCQADPNYCNGN
jgi:hypothetical protein